MPNSRDAQQNSRGGYGSDIALLTYRDDGMKEGVTVWLVRNFENKLDIWKFAIRIYFSGVGALSTIRSVTPAIRSKWRSK